MEVNQLPALLQVYVRLKPGEEALTVSLELAGRARNLNRCALLLRATWSRIMVMRRLCRIIATAHTGGSVPRGRTCPPFPPCSLMSCCAAVPTNHRPLDEPLEKALGRLRAGLASASTTGHVFPPTKP
jgi:hypothetical protein